MKKHLSLILILIMLLTSVSCAKNEEGKQSTSGGDTSSAEQTTLQDESTEGKNRKHIIFMDKYHDYGEERTSHWYPIPRTGEYSFTDTHNAFKAKEQYIQAPSGTNEERMSAFGYILIDDFSLLAEVVEGVTLKKTSEIYTANVFEEYIAYVVFRYAAAPFMNFVDYEIAFDAQSKVMSIKQHFTYYNGYDSVTSDVGNAIDIVLIERSLIEGTELKDITIAYEQLPEVIGDE